MAGAEKWGWGGWGWGTLLAGAIGGEFWSPYIGVIPFLISCLSRQQARYNVDKIQFAPGGMDETLLKTVVKHLPIGANWISAIHRFRAPQDPKSIYLGLGCPSTFSPFDPCVPCWPWVYLEKLDSRGSAQVGASQNRSWSPKMATVSFWPSLKYQPKGGRPL